MAYSCAIRLVVAAAMVLVASGGVAAQDRAVQGHVGATITAPLSGTADYFTPGLGGTAGFVWNLGEQYGVRVDGTWSTITPKTSPFDVSGRVQFATADVFFQAPSGRARLYVLGGVGVYRRSVTLSGGQSMSATVCVPWWFVCETGPASSAAGSRSTTNIGVNVGFGVSAGRWFGELRYHYADGPTFKTSTGDVPATGKFLPLTVGARF